MAQTGNAQQVLDGLKLAIALEVVRRFVPDEIRRHSRENLLRWKAAGVWSSAYDEWLHIIESNDDGELVKAMVGRDERANRLRQSMPYAGMLPRDVTRSLNREAANIGSGKDRVAAPTPRPKTKRPAG